MSRYNLQSILLAALVLGLAFIVRPNNKPKEAESVNKIEISSVNPAKPVLADKMDPIPSNKVISNLNDIKAKIILVKRLEDGKILAETNNNWRWPIASLTKLMTAVIALENLDPSQKIIFDDKIIATEGSSGGFQAGESVPVRDLIKALMGVSSNDAAVALAGAYGYQNFVDAMQSKAHELGMSQTTFFDSTGLSFLNQSTIGDLEKLALYILKRHPNVFEISKYPIIELPTRSLNNINEFAGKEDFLGGKTGFTDDANGNLISLFKDQGGKTLLIIVLGTNDRFGETKKLLNHFTASNP